MELDAVLPAETNEIENTIFSAMFKMPEVNVNKWKECIISNQIRKIPPVNLDDFIRTLQYTFQFPARDLTSECAKTIKDLARDCDQRGLSSSISGHLDRKTEVYGLIHCLLEEDGTLSVFYAFHTLTLELSMKQIEPEIWIQSDVHELEREIASSTLARSAFKTISEMGLSLGINVEFMIMNIK